MGRRHKAAGVPREVHVDLEQKNKQNITDGKRSFRQLYYIIEILKKQNRELREKLKKK
jgi:hypothetical protein